MPSAAKGAVFIMSERENQQVDQEVLSEEFKAFAMRGNVLDMAVGVVVGSAFTAIVNSLVNDIISPIIGLFFNADFSMIMQIGDVGIGVFLNAIINFLIVAFVLFVTIKAIDILLHKKPAEGRRSPPPRNALLQSEIAIKAVRCRCTSKTRGLPRSKAVIFPVFSPALSALWRLRRGFFAPFFRGAEENGIFSKKSIAFLGESWYYIRVVTTQQNMDG